MILLHEDQAQTFRVEKGRRYKHLTITETQVGTRLSSYTDWKRASIIACAEATKELHELIEQSKTSSWTVKKPTQEGFDDYHDQTQRDVDNTTLSWAEVQQRYGDLPDCSMEIIWACCLKVMTPLPPPQEDADWDVLDDFVKAEAVKNEPSASSSSVAKDPRVTTTTVILKSNTDSPRISRSARSTRSDAGSQATDRSASHEPFVRREPMTDRPPADKGERPKSCPPPWTQPAQEQTYPDEADVQPLPGQDQRRWRFSSATGFLKTPWCRYEVDEGRECQMP